MIRFVGRIGGRPLYCEATKSSDIIMAGSNLAKASHFILAASPIMNNKILADPEAYNKREFRSMFGTTPQVCATLWNLVDPTGPDSPLSMGRPKYEHLLCCCSEVASSYSSVAECDLQTRKKQFGHATLRRRCFSDYSHCTLRLLDRRRILIGDDSS